MPPVTIASSLLRALQMSCGLQGSQQDGVLRLDGLQLATKLCGFLAGRGSGIARLVALLAQAVGVLVRSIQLGAQLSSPVLCLLGLLLGQGRAALALFVLRAQLGPARWLASVAARWWQWPGLPA